VNSNHGIASAGRVGKGSVTYSISEDIATAAEVSQHSKVVVVLRTIYSADFEFKQMQNQVP